MSNEVAVVQTGIHGDESQFCPRNQCFWGRFEIFAPGLAVCTARFSVFPGLVSGTESAAWCQTALRAFRQSRHATRLRPLILIPMPLSRHGVEPLRKSRPGRPAFEKTPREEITPSGRPCLIRFSALGSSSSLRVLQPPEDAYNARRPFVKDGQNCARRRCEPSIGTLRWRRSALDGARDGAALAKYNGR